MPRISVITPCYNAERFIARTIESVRSQTLRDWEYIVVDDGSTDKSAAVVNTVLQAEPRLQLITQSNAGRAHACNTGFRNCSPGSRYLLFLDADDFLEPTMLEIMSEHLDKYPAVGLAYCNHIVVDANDDTLNKRQFSYLSPRYVPTLLWARELPPFVLETPFDAVYTLAGVLCSLSLIRRSIYEKTMGWDEQFDFMYDDTDLFLRIAIQSHVHYVPQELVRYRRHDAQSSAFADVQRSNETEAQKVMREHTLHQEQKLYAKWLAMTDLTLEQKQIVVAADRFRKGKLPLFRNVRTGNRQLRQGRILTAMRHYHGAIHFFLKYLRGRINDHNNSRSI